MDFTSPLAAPFDTAHATALALLLVLVTGTGCVSNHAFPLGGALDVPSLVRALDAHPADDDALFDVTYLPLLHLDLQTFSKTEEPPNYPEGHESFSIRSWLPLFLIVDGDVEFFDAEHAAFERTEFMAILWGLWARSEMTLQTAHGERVERSGRLLWLLDWDDSVEYVEHAPLASQP